MNAKKLLDLLATNGAVVPQLRYFTSTGSTNDDALKWVEENAPNGALVMADEQSQGRGRSGRGWVTEPGAALAVSYIFRPTRQEAAAAGLFSPLCAVALQQTLLHDYGLQANIKWPNDVLVQGKKVAGILVESSWLGDRLVALVLGIGINLALESVPPAEEMRFPAGCIEEFLNEKIDRWQFLGRYTRRLYGWRLQMLSEGFKQIWDDSLAFKGEEVIVQNHGRGQDLTGLLIGVDADGSLVLQTARGDEIHVAAGDVHLRPCPHNC